MKLNSNLSADYIEELIKRDIETRTGLIVESIEFTTYARYENNYKYEEFSGCTVTTVEAKKKSCPNQINDVCQNHNLQCGYPACLK